LAHDLKDVAGEFGEFVQKEDAVVGQRYFAWTGDGSATDQSGIGDGVMRRAERTDADQSGAGIEYSGDAMDLRGFEGFFKTKRGKNRGHAFGQHGLARARGADHEDVVAAGAGDLESTLGGLLAADVLEVDDIVLGFAQQGVAIYSQGLNAVAGIDEADDVEQRLHRIDFDASNHRGLAGIQFGHDQAWDFFTAGFYRYG